MNSIKTAIVAVPVIFLAACGIDTDRVEPSVPSDPAPIQSAVQDAPEPPGALEVGMTGTYFEADQEVGTVTVTEFSRFTEPDSEFGDPPQNADFLKATIVVEATGSQVYSVNPFDFYVRDAEGRRYEFSNGNALWAVGESMNHIDLNPGEKVTGTVVFDVPDGSLELVYAPGLRSLAYWELP